MKRQLNIKVVTDKVSYHHADKHIENNFKTCARQSGQELSIFMVLLASTRSAAKSQNFTAKQSAGQGTADGLCEFCYLQNWNVLQMKKTVYSQHSFEISSRQDLAVGTCSAEHRRPACGIFVLTILVT